MNALKCLLYHFFQNKFLNWIFNIFTWIIHFFYYHKMPFWFKESFMNFIDFFIAQVIENMIIIYYLYTLRTLSPSFDGFIKQQLTCLDLYIFIMISWLILLLHSFYYIILWCITWMHMYLDSVSVFKAHP